MKKSTLLVIAGLLTALAGSALAADEYAIDATHTNIGFGVKHMVVSTVKGNFKEFSGAIMLDEADMAKSSVKVTIKAASIDTNNQKRDDHLRSDEFLDAENYPEITFESRKIAKKGDGFVATGTLTIHGVSKEVSIPFELAGPIEDPWGNIRVGIAGELTINRRDYGLSWDNKLADGGLVVADDIKIELNIEAVRQKG